MFQQALFIARIQTLIKRDSALQARLSELMQWANTDEKVLRLITAMLNEKNRVEALNRPTLVKVEVPTDGGKRE